MAQAMNSCVNKWPNRLHPLEPCNYFISNSMLRPKKVWIQFLTHWYDSSSSSETQSMISNIKYASGPEPRRSNAMHQNPSNMICPKPHIGINTAKLTEILGTSWISSFRWYSLSPPAVCVVRFSRRSVFVVSARTISRFLLRPRDFSDLSFT